MQALIQNRMLISLNSLSYLTLLSIALAVLQLAACSTVPLGEREAARAAINDDSTKAVQLFLQQNEGLQSAYDSSSGYFVGWVSGAKVPALGGGIGNGVLYNNENSTRTYLDIKHLDLGLGLGAGRFQILVLFENSEALDRFQNGRWFTGLNADTSLKSGVNRPSPLFSEGTLFYVMGESGAGVTATARIAKLSVNEDLTDTGLSDISIPNTNFDIIDQQVDGAPRQWEHKLPFFAQEVIDEGYNLPLPYAISLIYSDIDQKFKLDKLDVGFNGAAKQPIEFVDFQNTRAKSESVQLKIDAWLFPFMNVFAMLGTLDGEAPVDVVLDGNGVLDYLEIDCSGPKPNLKCKLLEDNAFGFHLDVPLKGTTYSIGTTLVGGWNNYFVSLPVTFTYADMDGKNLEGIATTVTPRGGRVFNLDRLGSLALFVGGNYLKADLRVTGTVSCINTDLDCIDDDPQDPLTIAYTIEQSNTDRWNLLVGGSWDFNKHWSWHAEYGGFTGSRDAIITSFSYRY